MWDRPFIFVVLNLIIYVLLLSIFGFEIAPFITFLFAGFIFFYNIKTVGFFSSSCLSILYLLTFDSTAYTFTPLKLRMWYLPLLVLLALCSFTKDWKIKKHSIPILILVLILMFFSFYYLMIDEFQFKLHIIKYWLFYVGLICVLVVFFNKSRQDLKWLLEYLLSLAIFVAVFGIIQYLYNIRGNFSLINTAGNERPESFFSETTWYAEYLILGFVYVFLLEKITKNKAYYIWGFVFLLGLFISNTRNAFLGLFILVFFETFLLLYQRKINVSFGSQKAKVFTVVSVVLIVVLALVNSSLIIKQANSIIGRFNVRKDESGKGRIEAFAVSFKMAKETPLFGNGFSWTENVKAGVGNTAVGAKSFNLIFMVYHIFGPIGFLVFLFLIVLYFYYLIILFIKAPNAFSRSALYVFLIFFVMAMFAPIHQFPIGMQFVAFSIFLFNCGLNGKTLLYHS